MSVGDAVRAMWGITDPPSFVQRDTRENSQQVVAASRRFARPMNLQLRKLIEERWISKRAYFKEKHGDDRWDGKERPDGLPDHENEADEELIDTLVYLDQASKAGRNTPDLDIAFIRAEQCLDALLAHMKRSGIKRTGV